MQEKRDGESDGGTEKFFNPILKAKEEEKNGLICAM